MLLTTRAPAKINLTLHVLGRRADGYHELESLAAFTGAGDVLSLAPGPRLALEISGPTAKSAGAGADNLVLRAAKQLAERVEGLRLGAFRLTKLLPVAAGIGGGSSDAAAALRLLGKANDLALDDPRLLAAARASGADVSVCLTPSARMMRGAGEIIGESLQLSPLPAVLINPGVPLETKAIFARLGLKPGDSAGNGAHPLVAPGSGADTLYNALRKARNDLEDAASVAAPVIVDALAVLASAKGSRLARMSGSGATCFALFTTRRAAVRAAAVIRAQHPTWWVKSAILR
jgi:4-diphosphocytidyl-2-C-methyl-D-erythritol kinase